MKQAVDRVESVPSILPSGSRRNDTWWEFESPADPELKVKHKSQKRTQETKLKTLNSKNDHGELSVPSPLHCLNLAVLPYFTWSSVDNLRVGNKMKNSCLWYVLVLD
jgi:hypothetical protein